MKLSNKDFKFKVNWLLLLAYSIFAVFAGCLQQNTQSKTSNFQNGSICIRGRYVFSDNTELIKIAEIPDQQLDHERSKLIRVHITKLSKLSPQKIEDCNFKIASSDYVEIKQNGIVILYVTEQVIYKREGNYWNVYRDNALSEKIGIWVRQHKIRRGLSKLPPPI